MPDDFDFRLSMPDAETVLLLEVTAALPLEAWVASGAIWKARLPAGVSVASFAADEVSVTEGADVAAVEATPARWVVAAGWLYFHPAAGEPFDLDTVAMLAFFWSDCPKAFAHAFYDPRLKSVPKLSLRIEERLGGIAQVGGGKIGLENTDGFFDDLASRVRWDHGTVVLKMGIDRRDADMVYDDYRTLMTWALKSGDTTQSVFNLTVREKKEALKTKIPTAKFTREDWPTIKDALVGKVVPTIYGAVFSVEAKLVDQNTRRFKVASHAIKGFTGCRQQVDRKRSETKTPPWYPVTGESYYRTSFAFDDVKTVTVGSTKLAEVSDIDDIATTNNSWTLRDNFLYVRADAEPVPTEANTTVEIEVDYKIWQTLAFETRDAANAEFTVSADLWDGEATIVVDCQGKIDGDGNLITNPADVVEDILASVGETDLAASWATTRTWFDLGTDRQGTPKRWLALGFVMEKETDALKILEEINSQAGTYLFVNASGEWTLEAARPESGAALLDLTETEVFDLDRQEDTKEIPSQVEVTYSTRTTEKWSPRVTVANERLRRQAGLQVHTTRTVESWLTSERDAKYLAQRILTTEGKPLQLFSCKLPKLASFLLPGDKVKITRDRGSLYEVLEVIEIDWDLASKSVALVLGDCRGWGRSCGFWVGDAETAWDAGATDTEKADHAARSGFWKDTNGFAISTDDRSHMVSRWW